MKRGVSVNVLVTDNDFISAFEAYNKISYLGLPVIIENFSDYINITDDVINKWFYDKAGTEINILSEIVSAVLSGYQKNMCHFSSCISKNLYISEDGNVYLCKYDTDHPVCSVTDIAEFEDIYNNEQFMLRVKKAVEHRRICENNCQYYDICMGGCVLKNYDNKNKCPNIAYCKHFTYIKNLLNDVVKHDDYRELNPSVKQMIISSLASGELFKLYKE